MTDIEWHPRAELLVVRHSKGSIDDDKRAEFFISEGKTWKRVLRSAELWAVAQDEAASSVSVTIHQSINMSPRLMAYDGSTGKFNELWNPNPQLAEINLGKASVYHWHDKADHEWTGGLVWPPDYIRGRRYPLVIQTHGFEESDFLVDGASATANAARAIAARGIIVLQVREISNAHLTPREADVAGRDCYEAAIKQLSTEGSIDRDRVGIIGWSRTGWYVLESLITAPRLFAAATLAESTHGDLTQYWWLVDYPLGPVLSDSIAKGIGGRPIGAGLKKWIAKSPEFNTARIRAPILFEQNNPPALIYGWDIYAALRSGGKPVELLYIRNGDHSLNKPLERLASQEMNVDWYDFWLNRHEDSDPAKEEQYARWRELRKLQAENEKKTAN